MSTILLLIEGVVAIVVFLGIWFFLSIVKGITFSVIQLHGAVIIKFLVAWIGGLIALQLLIGAVVGRETARTSNWYSVVLVGGFLIAVLVCGLTARKRTG